MLARILVIVPVLLAVVSVGYGAIVFPDRKTLGILVQPWIIDDPSCPPLVSPRPDQLITRIPSGDVGELGKQLREADPGTTLLLEDGIYTLKAGNFLDIDVPSLILRSASGNRDTVRIEGGDIGLIVNADRFTVADLTISGSRYHAIQIRGERGVSATHIYNVHLVDTGQQLIKVSTGKGQGGKFAADGLVACSRIEYTTFSKGNGITSPSYTNGIDILAGKGWMIRDNELRRIRSQEGPAGPAILVWKNSMDTVIKRNVIVDSWRGIALGLMPPDHNSRGGENVTFDHQNGLVEGNVILALQEPADAAIENNFALNSKILHNTIYYRENLAHAVDWSIEYRFAPTRVTIQNNLANLPIRRRTPMPQHQAVMSGNITTATRAWFRNVAQKDVHLVSDSPAIDQGVPIEEQYVDIDGETRGFGTAPDPGADEYHN